MGDELMDEVWVKIARVTPKLLTTIAGVAYGSRVTGNGGPKSDYDLAIIVPAMPDVTESERVKSALRAETGQQIDLFFATPSGIQAKKTLDPVVFSLVRTGRLLWGQLGEWWKPEPFAVAGVEDAIISVESLTDAGDFSDLYPEIAEYSWRLLDGARAAWTGEALAGCGRVPRRGEMAKSISNLRDHLRSSLRGVSR